MSLRLGWDLVASNTGSRRPGMNAASDLGVFLTPSSEEQGLRPHTAVSLGLCLSAYPPRLSVGCTPELRSQHLAVPLGRRHCLSSFSLPQTSRIPLRWNLAI